MTDLALRMMLLFEGLDRAHGAFNLTGQRDEGGKVKGNAEIIREKVTQLLWLDHLEGKKGLGIVPINDKNQCKWGCIDVDEYPLDHQALKIRIVKAKLPLQVIRSKSGGCHLCCFLKDWVSASDLQPRLREFAAFLGFGGSEIFPKQTEILQERGDVGSWLNMPYFDANKTMRYAMGAKGEALSLEEFLEEAEGSRLTPEELLEFKLPTATSDMFLDGPPCLQQLHVQGLAAGTRNVALLNIAKYLKDKHGEEWKVRLDQYNSRLSNPLPSSEIQAIIKSRGNKDYHYQCKVEPLKSCCNSQVCRLRKYGVGGGSDLIITSIRRLNVDPVIWFLSLEDGGTVECTTEEMMSPSLFAVKCVEATNKMPKLCKAEAWRDMIREKLVDVVELDVPQEATNAGMFLDLLERFCTGKVQCNTEDELVLGKPLTQEGRTMFKLSGLIAFLERHRFQALKTNKVVSLLKSHPQLKCEHLGRHYHGKYVNLWSIKAFSSQVEPFDVKPREMALDEY